MTLIVRMVIVRMISGSLGNIECRNFGSGVPVKSWTPALALAPKLGQPSHAPVAGNGT